MFAKMFYKKSTQSCFNSLKPNLQICANYKTVHQKKAPITDDFIRRSDFILILNFLRLRINTFQHFKHFKHLPSPPEKVFLTESGPSRRMLLTQWAEPSIWETEIFSTHSSSIGFTFLPSFATFMRLKSAF